MTTHPEMFKLTVLFGFVDGCHLVGKTPKQERCHNTSPHFGHDVKHGEGPVANDCQGSRKPSWKERSKRVTERMGVQDGAIRVNDHCKEGKECQKGPDTGVKDVPLFHFVCQRCVDSCKPNGGGQVNISLDKWNDLGSTLRSGNHQNILCVSQDGVIEQNGKEHQGEWHKLFAFFFGRNDRFDLFRILISR